MRVMMCYSSISDLLSGLACSFSMSATGVAWCAEWVSVSSSEILRMYLPEFMEVRLRIL